MLRGRDKELYKKYNIDPDIINCNTYLVQDEYGFVQKHGIEMEIIPLKISIKCDMSDSITFNFKRCLMMVRCILDKYNI